MSNEAVTEIWGRVVNDFTYHAPSPDQAASMQTIRDTAKALALLIVETVPSGRERSLSLTNLEQVSMWANAGIARSGS